MKLSLEAIEKAQIAGLPVFLLAEQDKTLGGLPKDRAGSQSQVSAALKGQADKVLTDSVELVTGPEGTVAVLQVPQKKGLPREDKLRLAGSRILDLMKSRSWAKAAV